MFALSRLTRMSPKPLCRSVLLPILQRQFSNSARRQFDIRYVLFRIGEPERSRWRPQLNRWDTRTKIFAGACAVGASYYAYHLEQVEETGRWRFMDASPEEVREIAEEEEKQMLADYKEQLLPPSHPTAIHVTQVASRIINAGNLGTVKGIPTETQPSEGGDKPSVPPTGDELESEWEVFVVDDDCTVNAFVTPNRKIFVFTGILPPCANDDGLATVLGHEVAHQIARHGAETVSSWKVFLGLVVLLEVLCLDIGIARLGLTYLMSLPHSRAKESEADQIGLRLMAKACYNPSESVKFWQRMSEYTRQETKRSLLGLFKYTFSELDFHATHPTNSKRIKCLESWIPEALDIRAGSSCSLGENASIKDAVEDFKVSVLRSFGGMLLGGDLKG